MGPQALELLKSHFGLGGWIPRALDAGALLPTARDADEQGMLYALLSAMEGNGRANPNPCVGAALVKDGRLLARAATLSYGDLHAERNALAQLPADAARGSTCYVTLEPCGKVGKQPPCSEALIEAGIRRCVIGAEDSHPKVAGQGLAQLRAAGIEVAYSGFRGECYAWHFPFLAGLARQDSAPRPTLIGKWAQTLDGHLADDSGRSQWITGPQARAYTHWLRQKYDMVLVGVGTALVDAPQLTVRDAAPPLLRQPHKAIYDPKGRLSAAGPKVLAALRAELRAGGPQLYWIVEKGQTLSGNWWQEWEQEKILQRLSVEACSSWSEKLAALSAFYLEREGYPLQSIMVEGGSQLLTALLRADLLDACHVFIRAGILGGSEHRIGRLRVPPQGDSARINPPRALMERHDFRLLASQQLADDIVLECVHRRYDFW